MENIVAPRHIAPGREHRLHGARERGGRHHMQVERKLLSGGCDGGNRYGLQPQRWPLTLALFAPTLVYLVTHVNVRYRYSSIWMMALLAGHAIICLLERVRAATPAESKTEPRLPLAA